MSRRADQTINQDIIYGVWSSLDCDIEYYKTKESAKVKATEILVKFGKNHNFTEEEVNELLELLDREDQAYYKKICQGSEIDVDIVAIDELIVHD